MNKEFDVLKIVKEDILRILGERKDKVSLKSVKVKIKVSNSFLSKAIEDLKNKNLIRVEKNFVKLTKIGEAKARNIVKKYLVLENYFKKTRNEEEAHEVAHILEHYVSEEVIKNIKKLSTFKEKGIPLTKSKLGEESLITDITIPDNGQFERMVSLGIFPGNKIILMNKIPSGIVVKVKNKKFALSKNLAKEINVLK